MATKDKRWYKDVGLGFKTPAEAINGHYIGASRPSMHANAYCLQQVSVTDKKCPFTGDVSIRGRILTGKVVSTKMTRTIIIRRDYLHYIPKYSTSCVGILQRAADSSLFRSQTVTKRGTRTLRHMFLPHSVLTSEIWLLLVCPLLLPCNDKVHDVHCYHRPVPTALQDCTLQRSPCVEEQGCHQDLWEVLRM